MQLLFAPEPLRRPRLTTAQRLSSSAFLGRSRSAVQAPQYPVHDVIAASARKLEQLAALGRRMLRPVDTEAALRAVEAGADGRLIYTEARSSLDPTDTFDGAQDEHCTEHLGQTVDRLLEELPRSLRVTRAFHG
jgi:hypothetical protein